MMTKWPSLIDDLFQKMTGINWRNFTQKFTQLGPAKIKFGEMWSGKNEVHKGFTSNFSHSVF